MSEPGPEEWSIDGRIARIRQACAADPIDWNAIRGAAIGLDREAKTKDQKAAVQQLKDAADQRQILMAVGSIQRAFLQGKPDADGWPR